MSTTETRVEITGNIVVHQTFGLPPEVPNLIAKLRAMDPALLATIRETKPKEEAAP